MKSRFILILAGFLLVFFSYSSAQVPQLINYQGKLTTSTGAPVNDTLPIIFSIYADEGGTTLLWTETQGAVIIDKGIFNVLLGSVNPIGYSVFDGTARYLGVKVGVDPEITPRKAMVSVSYAFKSFEADTADYARGFSGIIENADKVDGLHASSTPTPAYLYPLDGFSKIPNARLYTGSGNGLDADLLDGQHSSSFLSTSSDYGRSGVATDLYEGTSKLTDKYVNVAGPDSVYVTSGTALYGKAIGSVAANMYGVRGYAEPVSSGYTAFGGYFEAKAAGYSNANGVWAKATSVDNTSVGVFATAENTADGIAYGGYFSTATTSSGTNKALVGYGSGTSSWPVIGVEGFAANNGTASATGGHFLTLEAGDGYHCAIRAEGKGASGSVTYGVSSSAYNTSTGAVYAGYFTASSSGTGTKYGVYASAPVAQGYAGYFSGDVKITDSLIVLGGKSAAVKVDNGEYRLLYSQESPESWFEDFGEGKLLNGKAIIQIDPLFAQTVNTNVKYHVFLTPLDEPLTLAVANKTQTSFEVIGPSGSYIYFSYRIVAKRKGFENTRLAKMKGPTPEEVAAEHAKIETEQARMKQDEERQEMKAQREKMEK
jgi:hypothetical protein